MKSRFIILTIALLLSALSPVVAQDVPTITIATWAAVDEAAEFQEIIDEINANTTEYQIVHQPTPAEYYTVVQTQLAAPGTGADMYWMDQDHMALKADGVFMDLSECLANSEPGTAGDLSDYYPGILAVNEYEGGIYGLPWIAQPVVTFYNKALFDAAIGRGLDAGDLLEHYRRRETLVNQYIEAYRRYCWEVNTLDDLTLAPFHLLATEGAVHIDKDHLWHMQMLARVCDQDEGLLLKTEHKVVDVTDEASITEGVPRWETMTGRGEEGMVVKPRHFIASGQRGSPEPASKVRGRGYLRIIYGPEYTAPDQIERLRARGLGAKRSLALREFALGIEALERFTRKEPLRSVHECAFGVLALESEPVDPRL